jgi:hypothetical protein
VFTAVKRELWKRRLIDLLLGKRRN